MLVVLMQQADRRDDCSRRLHMVPRSVGVCTGEREDPHCCDANLPPVTRTSDALREILSERAVVYGAYAFTPPFDPTTQSAEQLDTWRADGIDGECVYVVPQLRTVALARELYPDMHLLALACRGPLEGRERPPVDVGALARDAFGRLCEP